MKELEILFAALRQLPIWFWFASAGLIVMAGLTVTNLFSFILWLRQKN